MHMGTSRVVARDKSGHNPLYSRAYPRTTPSGTHTIYSHMQESHKKGAAANAMRDLERFESQVLVNTKSPGGHSFRKLCAKDLGACAQDPSKICAPDLGGTARIHPQKPQPLPHFGG